MQDLLATVTPGDDSFRNPAWIFRSLSLTVRSPERFLTPLHLK
jgi:hypothetical protein